MFPVADAASTILAARLIDRISKGMRDAPRDAFLTDVTPKPIRASGFGLRIAFYTIGFVVGPITAIGLMILSGDNFRFDDVTGDAAGLNGDIDDVALVSRVSRPRMIQPLEFKVRPVWSTSTLMKSPEPSGSSRMKPATDTRSSANWRFTTAPRNWRVGHVNSLYKLDSNTTDLWARAESLVLLGRQNLPRPRRRSGIVAKQQQRGISVEGLFRRCHACAAHQASTPKYNWFRACWLFNAPISSPSEEIPIRTSVTLAAIEEHDQETAVA
jgi:hypothetical protein